VLHNYVSGTESDRQGERRGETATETERQHSLGSRRFFTGNHVLSVLTSGVSLSGHKL